MTTTTRLVHFRSQQQLVRPVDAAPKPNLGEFWADGLATVALVTLFSTLVFEVLRLLVG
jgi:hypothetical protein